MQRDARQARPVRSFQPRKWEEVNKEVRSQVCQLTQEQENILD